MHSPQIITAPRATTADLNAADPVRIPTLPRVTTQVAALNPELWPGLAEQVAALEEMER